MADERYVCTMAPFFTMGSFGPYLISPCISIILCGLQKRFEELFLTVCLLVSYNAAAVITEDKIAFLTYGTKKFTALW